MQAPAPFADRRAAGRALAQVLAKKRLDSPLVLALPRGGVPAAAEIARALDAPPWTSFSCARSACPSRENSPLPLSSMAGKPEIVTNEDVVRLKTFYERFAGILAAPPAT